MTLDQLQHDLDRHGADLSLWPPALRAEAERLMADDAAARAAGDKAGRIDALLSRHVAADATAETAAAARVLATLTAQPLPRQKGRPLWSWPGVLLDWDFAPAWPRVAALACCAALGFAVGISGLDRRLDGGAAFNVATATDLSSIVFEPEPLTGLRP